MGTARTLPRPLCWVCLFQMGSFVPASSMTFSPADMLFSRVGASDDIASDTSTFMMEMLETAA
jgi:DNA mismatch repair protein MutS